MEKCPRCGEERMREPQVMNALSRRDNKTYICSECGTAEAMFDWAAQEYIKSAAHEIRLLGGKSAAKARTEFALKLTGAMREEQAWLERPWDTGLTADLMKQIERAERVAA